MVTKLAFLNQHKNNSVRITIPFNKKTRKYWFFAFEIYLRFIVISSGRH
ncbi:MAG: hypothetical protein ACI9V1_003666, partial [Spirosomataceae bacterium]